jgi:hypothetical protein
MPIESLVRKKYFLTSEQSESFVDRGRQICCTESFFLSVFKILSEY